jgi:hypothetical protein
MPYSAWSIPHTVFDYGTTSAPCLQAGTTVCKAGGSPMTVYDIASQYTNASYSTTQYVNQKSNADHFGTMEFAVGKAMTHRFSLNASYTATKNHLYSPNIQSSLGSAPQGNTGPQAIVTNPNQLTYPLNTLWYWTARISGAVRLPLKFEFAPNLTMYTGIQGGRYLSFSLPNYGTINLPTEAFGSEVTTYRTVLNFRFSRDIKFERIGNFRANIEVLNATNNSAPWGVTSWSSGSSYGKTSSTSTPMIARFGVIYTK